MKYSPAMQQVWAAVKTTLGFGVSVETGNWIARSPEGQITRVCACGAVLAALGIPKTTNIESGESVIRAVARKLGITVDQAVSLNNGFEDIGIDAAYAHGAHNLGYRYIDTEWYVLGQRVARYAAKHAGTA